MFYQQGLGLDSGLFNFSGIQIPVASLNLFDICSILALVPIFERVIYPFFDKFNINFGSLKRIFIGNIIIIMAMICAGVLECFRLSYIDHGHSIVQKINDQFIVSANLTIIYQIPQYALVGTSEILVCITGLEFAYDQAPPNMKSVVMSCYLLTSAMGNFIGAFIIFLINFISTELMHIGKIISDDNINSSALNYYFFIIASIGFFNLIIYFFIARRYRFKRSLLQIQSDDE